MKAMTNSLTDVEVSLMRRAAGSGFVGPNSFVEEEAMTALLKRRLLSKSSSRRQGAVAQLTKARLDGFAGH